MAEKKLREIYLSDTEIFPIYGFPLGISIQNQVMDVPLHLHDFWEITLLQKGYGMHHVGKCDSKLLSYSLIPGDVFSIMPGEVHEYKVPENMQICNFYFLPEILDPVRSTLEKFPAFDSLFPDTRNTNRHKIHISGAVRSEAEYCVEKMSREICRKQIGFQMNIRLAFYEFLLTVLRETPLNFEKSQLNDSGIAKTISLMEAAPEKNYSLSELAGKASMSISGYTRKFRQATGESVIEYLQNIRLEKARIMLEQGRFNNSEIADMCGLSDGSYLIKLFLRRYGMTPAKYSRELKHIYLK